MHVIGIGTKAATADISHMRGAGKKPDQLTFVERWRDNGNVMLMACPFPRVIGDVDIAVKHVLAADTADEMGQPHLPLH